MKPQPTNLGPTAPPKKEGKIKKKKKRERRTKTAARTAKTTTGTQKTLEPALLPARENDTRRKAVQQQKGVHESSDSIASTSAKRRAARCPLPPLTSHLLDAEVVHDLLPAFLYVLHRASGEPRERSEGQHIFHLVRCGGINLNTAHAGELTITRPIIGSRQHWIAQQPRGTGIGLRPPSTDTLAATRAVHTHVVREPATTFPRDHG